MEMKESKVLDVYATHKGKWTMHKDSPLWNGHEVQIRIALYTFNGKQKLCVDMAYSGAKKQLGFHLLGCVKQAYISYYPVGLTKTMRIYATKFSRENGLVKEMVLFDPSMPQWQIDEWLNFK